MYWFVAGYGQAREIIHLRQFEMPRHKCLPSNSVNCHVFFLTDNCQGVCFLHPVPRSTNPPGTTTVTKIVTTKGKTSTERDIAAVSGKIADWLTILIDWGYIKEQLPKISLILFVCLFVCFFWFCFVLFLFLCLFWFVVVCFLCFCFYPFLFHFDLSFHVFGFVSFGCSACMLLCSSLMLFCFCVRGRV